MSGIDDVFRLIDDDPWPLAREVAASGDPSLVPPAQAALERCLDDHDWYGRDLMAYILVGLRGSAAFVLVLRAFARPLTGGDHRRVIGDLVTGLMRDDRQGCRRTVLAFAVAPHPDLRRAAMWALGHVVEPADLPLLRSAVTDPDPSVRDAAVGSLPGLKDDPRAFGLMVTALADPDDQVRVAAVAGLRWFGDPGAVRHLAPLAADPAPRVRAFLGATLAALPGGQDVISLLLDDPEPEVRAEAARGIRRPEVVRARAVCSADNGLPRRPGSP